MHRYIFNINKSIYGIVQEAHLWFKECIKTMTLKVIFNQYKTDPCFLYRVNELGTAILIIYVDETLTIRDKPALMNKIGCIKK